uniref:Pentatricopeptide repeat-containing protein n=1 Tax=Populus davidiana TaxID=266767 RepID=A0A6M2F707_9ROSI
MGWLVFMTCVVVWVLLDTCLMEFLLEIMDFLSMTVGYSKHNCWDETWKLFESMSVEGNVEPEEVTMIAARSTCSQKGGLRLGKSFHEYVKLEMQITMNVKCGCLDL